MARKRPRKGKHDKRRKGASPVLPFAGEFASPVTPDPSQELEGANPDLPLTGQFPSPAPFGVAGGPGGTEDALVVSLTVLPLDARARARSMFGGPARTDRSGGARGATWGESAVASSKRRSRRGLEVSKKQLLGSASAIVTLIAASSLVVGITFSIFTAMSPAQSNNFASGSVSLATSAMQSCPIAGLLPTGVTATPCTFTETYSGSTSAYLATDVLIETQAGSGGIPLYNPTDASNDLQVTITSTTPSVTYSVPTESTTCPGTPAEGSVCYALDNELVATTPFAATSTVDFAISVSLPTSSLTGYQGGTAQVILTTHAVQSAHNTLACVSAVPGTPCVTSGTFGWN